jgi:Uma2 family endonuclease
MATARTERRRFSVDDYHRMAEAGILGEDDRVELVAGEIVQMSPIGSRHAACVKRLNRLLSARLGEDVLIGIQDPVALAGDLEPQPDVSILRAREDDYAQELPGPHDVLLVIEVAETSLAYDREVKLPLYAAQGIAEAWLVNLADEVLERHTEPSPRGYRLVARAGRGEELASTVLPSLSLQAGSILG